MTELIFNKNEAAAKAKKRAALRREIVGTLMILAPLVCFIAFTLFPMLISLIVSFNDLHSYNMKYMEFVGWDNYKKIFAIGEFSDIVTPLSLWDSIKNTLLFSLCVPINLISAVFLANIISKKMPGNKFMRVILFMPQICSGVAVTLMWQWIFEDSFGVINTMLAAVGLNKVHWLTLAIHVRRAHYQSLATRHKRNYFGIGVFKCKSIYAGSCADRRRKRVSSILESDVPRAYALDFLSSRDVDDRGVARTDGNADHHNERRRTGILYLPPCVYIHVHVGHGNCVRAFVDYGDFHYPH